VRKIIAICFLLSCLIAFGQSRNEAEQKASLENAQRLFLTKCANCHGRDGSAHTAVATRMKVADLRSKPVQQMSDDELYDATAEGTGHKSYPHAFLHSGLTENQIRDLIKYIRTFQKPK
jgi:mono/diheme cytochrome c family protein